MFLFKRFWWDVRREFMQRISAALHGSLGSVYAMLGRRAVLMLWHAFLFLGLRSFPLFFFLLGGLHCFFLSEYLVIS
jgi:uncharacterized membrane protein